MIREHLATMFVEVGRHLASDPHIRADMNQGFVVALASFVESQKSGVSSFIADQVKRWDLAQLTRLIEMNIGRDLQYIRFNGMVIGGLAGLVLHRSSAAARRIDRSSAAALCWSGTSGSASEPNGRNDHGQQTGIRHRSWTCSASSASDLKMPSVDVDAILSHHRKNLEALEKSAKATRCRRIVA